MSGVLLLILPDGLPNEHAGRLLERYDPDGENGRGSIITTTDIAKAHRFADAGAALACWKQQSTVRPWRPDGKPNRPLTAFTVQVVQA